MASRVRFLTMLVILLAWGAYVGGTVVRGQAPDQLVWGIPAGAYVALYQPWRQQGQQRGADDREGGP